MFRFLIILTLINIMAFGCDANCVSCHPKLIKSGKMDKTHGILNKCVDCHVKKPDDVNHGACGADCFTCHQIENVKPKDIMEHKVLKDCIKCHVTLDKTFFTGKSESRSFLQDELNGL